MSLVHRQLGRILLVMAALGAAQAAAAGEPFAYSDAPAPAAKTAPADDLTRLSMEDLLNTEITSVSKQTQRVADAPAAVYVITQEDIRRSGMTFIPELLRLAPGLDVARINANEWAVSSRGFNDLYARKLLVLEDGRTLYSPLYSGVFWEAQDYILADLDRIEVIRGPGATLWGSNAVNGVINITSKSARDTQGGLVEGRYGNEEQIGSARYGGKLDDKTFYRVYTKYRNVDDQTLPDGDEANDGWDNLRGGFRIDRYATDSDIYTLQGDAYESRIGQSANFPVLTPPFIDVRSYSFNSNGGNLLGRWQHQIDRDSDFMVQGYYDRIDRQDKLVGYEQNTFDIEAQHRFRLGKSNQIIWGAGYRFMADSIQNSDVATWDPGQRDLYLASAFVQDNIAIVPERLHAFVGSKFEVNTFTGFEVQPSARLLWTPDERNSLWGAVSYAVRTPSRFEEDVHAPASIMVLPNNMTAVAEVNGNRDMEAEKVTAYELGYRTQLTKAWSLDIAAFYNVYDDLQSFSLGSPSISLQPPAHLVLPLNVSNGVEAQTWGLELASTAHITDRWRLVTIYSFLNIDARARADGQPSDASVIEGCVPRNQFQVRSYWDITRHVECNAAVFYVDRLADLGNDAVEAKVPAYVRVDLNFVWHVNKSLDLSAGVQNLFDDSHPEFGGTRQLEVSDEIGRCVWVQAAWRF